MPNFVVFASLRNSAFGNSFWRRIVYKTFRSFAVWWTFLLTQDGKVIFEPRLADNPIRSEFYWLFPRWTFTSVTSCRRVLGTDHIAFVKLTDIHVHRLKRSCGFAEASQARTCWADRWFWAHRSSCKFILRIAIGWACSKQIRGLSHRVQIAETLQISKNTLTMWFRYLGRNPNSVLLLLSTLPISIWKFQRYKFSIISAWKFWFLLNA